MKKSYFLGGLLVVLILATFTFGQTVTKGLIGKEDINLTQTDNGSAETFSRATSTGATITLTKLDGNAIPWSSSYTRTIRPLHITGNGSTSVLSNFLTGTFSGTVTAATLASSGAATIGTTLGVTGAALFSSSVTSDSLTTGSGTFSGNINANGNIVGDSATTVSGIARYSMDGIAYDTGTAAPTSGTWVKGSIVWNSSPTARTTIAATGAIGWRCTAAGTPGTWEAIFPVFVATPDNAAMTCTAGMVAIDNSYNYSCVATNTWNRVGSATW